MRISSKLKRTSLGREPKSKYYIVTEGDNTEQTYFIGINDSRDLLNINPLIQIITIENDESEHGISHPLRKLEMFKRDIDNNIFTYDENIDKVCFIVDRDPKNFKEDQYNRFLEMCEQYNYFAYVSNPTFEFFLLLHSDTVFKINKKDMFENRKITGKKRFLEVEVSKIFGCNKSNIKFEKFKDSVKIAIQNEKEFEEDIYLLKDRLGSNVGKLLKELMD